MTSEEIKIRFGMDASSVNAGTNAVLDRQKKAALEYVEFWGAAMKARDRAEAELNAKSLARLEARKLAEREAAAEWMAERAAQIEIGRGSIPANMLEKAAGLGGAVAAEKGLKEVGEAAHGSAGILRESMVLVREALRGNWTRMVGSASILAGYLGIMAPILAGLAAAAPILAYVGYRGYQTKQAVDAEKASGKDYEEMSKNAGESARKKLAELHRAGLVTDAEREQYEAQIRQGDVAGALTGINKLSTGLNSTNDRNQRMKSAEESEKRLTEQLTAQEQKQRSLADVEKDIKDKNELIANYKADISRMDKTTLDYHEAHAHQLQTEVDLQKDLTEQKRMQAEQAQKQKEWQEWSNQAARTYMRNQIHNAMDEAEYPTIENLAGRNWMKRLQAAYGPGGSRDLGAGNGPFADVARDYERMKYEQQWARIYGNNPLAEADRKRMISDRDFLVSSGVASPQLLLGKIEDNTSRLRALFDSLVTSGVIIRGTDN